VRLGTYNVHGFRGFGEGPDRPDLSQGPVWVEALARLACDVLALQEAGDDPVRVREIARGLGMEALWLPSPGRWPGAILWGHRFRCVEGGVLRTEAAGEDGPFSRSAGFVRLEAADRGPDAEPDERLDRETLEILSIHAHPSDAEMRMQEALRLEEWWEGFRSIERLERDGDRPTAGSTAVMGDFNSESGEPLHRTLARLGLQSVFEPGRAPRTHLKDRDRVAVDHIHLSRGLRGALRGAGVVREAGFQPGTPGGWAFSDHLPVVADLAWSPLRAAPIDAGPLRSAVPESEKSGGRPGSEGAAEE